MTKYPAALTAHTPTGVTHVCMRHAGGLMRLYNMLGTHVAMNSAPECANCKNEAQKSEVTP